MAFTNEEFDIMVQQLLYQSPVSFEMLCTIAQRTLAGSVYKWCAADSTLRGKGHEKDILQDIHIRLIQTVVTSFLLREGEDGPVNRDPAGFRSWMFRVAKNLTLDYAASLRRLQSNTVSREDLPDVPVETDAPPEPLLAAAVQVVLESDGSVYKTITWLAQSIFVLRQGMSRILANHLLVEHFSRKPLGELWELVLAGSRQIPWMQISPEQKARIECQLQQPYDESRSYGQTCYAEFFMKKGPKASISDWINRMDERIKRINSKEGSDGI